MPYSNIIMKWGLIMYLHKEEDFYKDDYELRTRGLISDDIGCDMVICFYKELMERVFA